VPELPRWVWDLLADLIDEEDVHPKLYAEMFVTASGKHEMVPYDWCPSSALAHVPADIRGAARIIAGYRRVSAPVDLEEKESPRD
jgi:hypothetical protein